MAGVSYQTVSFVINIMPRVSEETRLRVLSAIEELQYTPNAAARNLRSGESKIIGLMIPDVDIVWSHYEEAGQELMNHLLGLGHQQIGFINRQAVCPPVDCAFEQSRSSPAAGPSFDKIDHSGFSRTLS